MTITAKSLFRSAAVAAVAAGTIFIGVQVGHPPSEVDAVSTTEWAWRNAAKVLMAALALTGITGMYLRQVERIGVLGLVGYVLFAVGYLTIMSVAFVSAVVLPSIADANAGYVDDVLAAATGGSAVSDIGSMQSALAFSGITYLLGGLVFGIALYRARVLARWAAGLLAAASVFTVTLAVLPDALYRFLAVPNGVAMVGLGCSLWVTTRPATRLPAGGPAPTLDATVAP